MNIDRLILSRIKTVFVFALILIIFTTLTSGCTKSEDLAQVHYDKGVALFQAEDYKGAILEFKTALQLDPRLSKAHYQLGLAYIEVKDAVNAYRELEMAAQVDPSNVDAIIQAAEMLFLGNEIHESRTRLKKALAIDPDNINALILSANLELNANHINEAESYIEKALKLNPDLDRIYLTRANIYLAKGNYEKLRESIEKALSLNPENESAYRALIIYWIGINKPDMANTTIQEMFDIFPDSPLPYLEMAKIQELQKDITGAAESLQKALAKDPQEPELYVTLARFYEKHGSFQKAESSYLEAVNVARSPIDYQAILADFYFNQKKFDMAREQANIVLAKYPEHMYGNFVNAKLFLEADNNINEAISLLEKLAVKNPQWGDVFFYSARAHFKVHEIDEAFKTIEKAVVLAPDNPDYRLLLAYILFSRGDFYRARVEAELAHKSKTYSYAAALLYGKSLYMTASYTEAINLFERMNSVKPNDYEILLNLGLSQMAVEDYNRAERSLLKAVSINNGYTQALEALLNILIIKNYKSRAISLLEDQIEANPLSPNLLLIYGTLLYNEGRLKESLTSFRKVQEIAPDSPAAYMMEALILKKTGKFDEEVAKRYRDIAHDKTADPDSQMVLARLMEMANDIEGAKDAYKRVLELSPDSPTAANNLAWLMANDGNPEDLTEAMNLAQLAKDKQPSDPNFIDTLGWVYYKQGQYYVAALEFQKAIEKSPATPVYHYHLALALVGQDNREDAISALTQSLVLADSFAERDEAEALYKKLTGKDFSQN